MKFDIAMAFQPIVNIETGEPFAYEALVRGIDGAGANEVLSAVTDEGRYAFDLQCRVAAIAGAVEAGILESRARLSINFLPNAVYSPVACIQLTLKTAQSVGLPIDRLLFEFTENEAINDSQHLKGIVDAYRKMGFGTAIDDFGAGHAGLGLLAEFQPDYIKIDMALVRDIDCNIPRQVIVSGIVRIANSLGIEVIAEGIETVAEYNTLRTMGIRYMQGYLIARPAFRALPAFQLPISDLAAAA
jgi:EAL domain-containing protein (putative c-di-GMP-specific phosphodiesterase class I)